MGAYTCQFGVVHRVCRCPKPHSINCDVPKEHGPSTDPHGEWIFQQKNVHVCVKPDYSRGVRVGDKWRCNECQTVWRVKKILEDQRDNWTGIEWSKETSSVDPY